MSYKYMAKAWKRPAASYVKDVMWEEAIKWRRQPAILRIERPTRLDRARKLGYKAKTGFILARIRVKRGGLRKSRPKAGRRPKRMGVVRYKPAKSMRLIAEERAARKFSNLEVLTSYWVWEDGRFKWFEVIMVDPNESAIASDKSVNWIWQRSYRGRAFRGLTFAGKKVRGLSHRGRGTEKVRPSRKASRKSRSQKEK